jgi:hypothetical protein
MCKTSRIIIWWGRSLAIAGMALPWLILIQNNALPNRLWRKSNAAGRCWRGFGAIFGAIRAYC